jgi:Flp pilus assembly protein TadD
MPDDAMPPRAFAALPATLPDPNATTADAPAAESGAVQRLGRYELCGEVGRGGMGCVLKARDPDLDRYLAVKVLLYGDEQPEVRRRFLVEARTGARLQHPGVVPVYEVGQTEQDRPYFAMKLVEGRTLADLLRERPSPAHDLPRFVAIFEQVCQTIAYAHSRGVIHRDLKPANILVGAFGEVQVMDWGLAKARAEAGGGLTPAGEAEPAPGAPRPPGLTAAGTVLGTPAYMAPEQARGEVEEVDERADVFGLGALLCEVLTGSPPFGGGDALGRAARGELAEAFARLDGCGADVELVALARDCLAAEREARPRDAGVVAARVTAYRAGVQERLRRAELDRAAAQAKAAEERKRRRVTLALAGSLLLLAALVGGGLLWWQQDRHAREQDRNRRLNQTRAEVTPALSRAEQWRKEARTIQGRSVAQAERASGLLRQARAAVEQAESALATGLADASVNREVAEARAAVEAEQAEATRWLTRATKEAAFLAALEKARERRGTIDKNQLDVKGASEAYARAFREHGRDVTEGSEADAAAWVRGLPNEVREAALVALYDWEPYAPSQGLEERLWRIVGQADADPWRRRFQEAVDTKDPALLQQLTREARARPLPAVFYPLLAALLQREGRKGEAVELLRTARLLYPRDFWIPFELGNSLCLGSNGRRLSEAEREEVAGCFRTALAIRPESSATHSNLGLALMAQKKLGEGEAALRRAIDLDPGNTLAHNNLGAVLKARNKLGEAEAACRKAIALDPGNAQAHTNLGAVLRVQNKVGEAVTVLRKAIALDPGLAEAHNNLGSALEDQHRLGEAEAAYRKALAIDPNYAEVHNNLGNVLADQNKPGEAVAVYRRALDLDPGLVQAHHGLGIALAAQNKLGEAVAAYRKAIDLDPRNGEVHGALGHALLRAGHFSEARISTRRCLDLLPQEHPQRRLALRQLQQCEHLLVLDAKLSAILKGEARAGDATECLGLAEVCCLKQRPAAAARFFADAFAAEPRRADDLSSALRYNAACAAALAAAGRGQDAAGLEEKERARLRKLARDWLEADLKAWARKLDGKPAKVVRDRAATALRHWEQDADLSGVRHPWSLLRLPAEEQRQWQKLWADVDALRERTGDAR